VTGSSVPLDRRIALLDAVAAFDSLPKDALADLAARLREERFSAEQVIVREGELGDRLYLIADGRAEVTSGGRGSLPLAVLEEGELFGEVALLSGSRERQATVTADTHVVALTLSAADFEKLVRERPEVRDSLAGVAETLVMIKFLKQASPFTPLSGEQLRQLIPRLERRGVSEGETVVRQGEPGDACYLVRSGRVEVAVQGPDGEERQLATLGPGCLFGEAALLTQAPRAASVRALERAELLVLPRRVLLECMQTSENLNRAIVELIQLRERPRRDPDVELHERTSSEGETLVILKQPARGAYYQLTPEGRFIWDLLDGEHTLRDLTMEYLRVFKAFAPQVIAEVVRGLRAGGFVQGAEVSAGLLGRGSGAWSVLRQRVRRVFDCQVALPNADAAFARVYRTAVRPLFNPVGQVALAAIALGGLAAFVVAGHEVGRSWHETNAGARLLLFLIPAYLAGVMVHEAGHAFAAKALGYEVRRAGLGLYRGRPVAFVDTSDMWLAPRWPRILVSLAGPYANLVLAGAAALGAVLATAPAVTTALWQFAFVSYVAVVLNLNPMYDYDGYYVLMDVLERPNLRKHTLQWLSRGLPRALRRPQELGRHRVELAYGLALFLYPVVMGLLSMQAYRVLGQHWLSRILPAGTAAALGGWVAAAVIAAGVAGVAIEMYRLRRGQV